MANYINYRLKKQTFAYRTLPVIKLKSNRPKWPEKWLEKWPEIIMKKNSSMAFARSDIFLDDIFPERHLLGLHLPGRHVPVVVFARRKFSRKTCRPGNYRSEQLPSRQMSLQANVFRQVNVVRANVVRANIVRANVTSGKNLPGKCQSDPLQSDFSNVSWGHLGT
jgi:hypothetical protein